MSGSAAAPNDNERFVVALLREGGTRRFDKKEDAPEGSVVFSSIEELRKLSIEELDKIAGMILKAQISASKNKEAAVDRTWTALLAISATPPAAEPKKGARSSRISNTTFKLTFDFDSPSESEAEKFKNLPPQAQKCLKIMARGGKPEYSEAELRKLVEDNGTDFHTVQEPWRIFQYYRRRLSEDKMIQAA